MCLRMIQYVAMGNRIFQPNLINNFLRDSTSFNDPVEVEHKANV